MKVLLATGVIELDNAIMERVKNIDFTDSVLYKEAVVDKVERTTPDVIILSELLQGVTPTRELILTLRTRFPKVRIIFLLKDENLKEEAFLYHWMIFDVFSGKFTVPELEEALFKPKQFHDVTARIKELEGYAKDPDFDEPEPDITDMRRIRRSARQIESPEIGTDSVFQEIVAFWSVLDQSARTFSAVNSALLLASNKDVKVLLLDFNLENPNLQLHFGFSDPNRNLGAIFEDYHNGDEEVTEEDLRKYVVVHPDYDNLHILPGNILNLKNPENEGVIKLFDSIMQAAENSDYTTILIDTGSGVDNDLTVHILQHATRILMHVNETPGNLYAIRRMFDTLIGPFVEKLIDRKKIEVIVTNSFEDTRSNFRRALQVTLSQHVKATIPYHAEVRKSIFTSEPMIANKPPEEIYNSFVRICNLIHNNIFVNPIKTVKSTKKKVKKGGLFGKKKEDVKDTKQQAKKK